MRNEYERKGLLPLAALSCLSLAAVSVACARILALEAASARSFELSRRSDAELSLRMESLSSALDGTALALAESLRENAASNGKSLDRNAADTRKALAALRERLDLAVSGLALANASAEGEGSGRGLPSRADFAADYRVISDNAEAGALYAKGDYPAAAEKYRAVTEALPRDAEARLFLAACLYRSGRRTLDALDEMERCLSAAESARGRDPLALEIKAGLLTESGSWADACRAYEELERSSGFGEGGARTEILRLYGTALLNAGKPHDAALRFDQAIASAPEDPSLLRSAGDAYSAAGMPEEAAKRYASRSALGSGELR